jgi:(S)-ureidoglycine aminohydrolase
MPQHGLVGSRAVVERRYALLPPAGIPETVLPGWTGTAARVLAAPAMGAGFVETQLDLAAGGGAEKVLPAGVEAVFYVVSGDVTLRLDDGRHALGAGGFAFVPPGAGFGLHAGKAPARVLWIKKRHQPADGVGSPAALVGNENDVKGEPFLGIDELTLKTLLPLDLAYDIALNVFTFPPGFGLPMTETHVMEHGLYFLEGQGLYYLGDRWHEVERGDFIWMGPYCPQSFFATGSSPSRYVYSKDVHRDVEP